MTASSLYIAALCNLFLPLVAGLVYVVRGGRLHRSAFNIISCLSMAGCTAAACVIAYHILVLHKTVTFVLAPFINLSGVATSWAIHLDPLSAVMIFTVSSVSFLVHVYSVGYMSHDKSPQRFMAYLGLFTFFMLALVTAANLLQLFFGWEGVGLASYLLIGFWYEKKSACAAAIKAFLMNRVADVGFVIGILGCFWVFGSVNFIEIFAHLTKPNAHMMPGVMGLGIYDVVAIFLFIGAMGKSAQLGLHTWLPDAMEGPTPVSALIHAATMVTAGVFLVARMSPLYDMAPVARSLILYVGLATAFFAGTVALVQSDIKRVIAYSTCSQLGFMFASLGAGAYAAAIFHLFTHAFFKALLFLNAGAVIHALSDEQNMFKMGGLARLLPGIYIMMWIGSLALAGVPLFAGYYSKHAIFDALLAQGTGFFITAALIALLTAIYSWRLIILTFHGSTREDDRVLAHLHGPGLIMLIPLVLLSVGAIIAGLGSTAFLHTPDFWQGSLVTPHIPHAHGLFGALPTILGGLAIAATCYIWLMHQSGLTWLSTTFSRSYRFLVNRWYFDYLYDVVIANGFLRLGHLFWTGGDQRIINGFGPDGVSTLAQNTSTRALRLQTGYLYHYSFAMVAGIAMLVAIVLIFKSQGVFHG